MNSIRKIQIRIKSESLRMCTLRPVARNRHLFKDPTFTKYVQKY
ncbi:hypothetical protein [Aequorivita viscosa]|nr:hypothetical protein [Aequorivita viscosa]